MDTTESSAPHAHPSTEDHDIRVLTLSLVEPENPS
jgi:hypothetical protein